MQKKLIPSEATHRILRITTASMPPAYYRRHTRSAINTPLEDALRISLMGAEFTPVGREKFPRKLPSSAESTKPAPGSGWWWLDATSFFAGLEKSNPEQHTEWAKWFIANNFALMEKDVILIHPEYCEEVREFRRL